MEQRFILNERFLVDPATNLITDKHTGTNNRLETRLMQVLCILTANAGRTVLREELVEKVWQNYGGGDEGLTQAISALRKALQDTNKKIIQTVPKKGYLCSGTITEVSRHLPRRSSLNGAIIVKASATAAVLLLLIYFFANTHWKTPQGDNQAISKSLTASENIFDQAGAINSVTYHDNRNAYKWVSNGDAEPEFYINNLRVPIGQWEAHMPIINHLKHKLQGKLHRQKMF
ncbi:winged helix-turn-helix domain-containing protein [Mucilaginibacter sp. RS28]|uniref:Winged helix-turn-helix domain-containing protein n=1 Tax=Mucilaginibacter straminoryzae TaxID=2932774 RepID=A0A9X2BDY2_9SPHI|nr:winged helix-turn-helix domain-containing protein [Mucilaginibacter straminoryzae]MCJ8210828.1 winged helix-turn-helix domain-containing protein [Mucilaginibacter straminoryzae]